jgi:hypothetical protein
MEELMKFTLLRAVAVTITDRYSERKEAFLSGSTSASI